MARAATPGIPSRPYRLAIARLAQVSEPSMLRYYAQPERLRRPARAAIEAAVAKLGPEQTGPDYSRVGVSS